MNRKLDREGIDMTPKDLPELPATDYVLGREGDCYGNDDRLLSEAGYSDDDMHAYGRKCYELGARSTAAQPVEPTEAMAFEVRVAGPDDVIPFTDEIAALRYANANNLIYIADRLKHPDDEVMCIATVHALGLSAASGDSTPPSAPVQGDPTGAPRAKPEAAGQDLVLAERERCATICMDLYELVSGGAGCCAVSPGYRLEQAARLIREGRPAHGWYAMSAQVPEPPQAASGSRGD